MCGPGTIAITRHSAMVTAAPMPITDQMTGQHEANVTIDLASCTQGAFRARIPSIPRRVTQ
jgi:hypothetical protein